MFIVYGGASSGKSVLAKWIADRLKAYRQGVHLFHSFGKIDLPTTRTLTDLPSDRETKPNQSSLILVKAFLGQLLQRRIGDVQLYKRLSDVSESMAAAEGTKKSEALEAALWKIFGDCFNATPDDFTIVIDGLDSVADPDQLLRQIQRIGELVESHRFRCVFLSRRFTTPISIPRKEYTITEKDVDSDLDCFIWHVLDGFPGFGALGSDQKDEIRLKLIFQCKGSYLSAKLLLEIIKRQKTIQDILSSLDSQPTDASDIIEKMISGLDFRSKDTRRIFSWLLSSREDVTVNQFHEILALDVSAPPKKSPRRGDVREDITKACGALVVFVRDVVRFMDRSMKEGILKVLKAKNLLSLEDCHREVLDCLLAYASSCDLGPEVATITKEMHSDVVEGQLKKYNLLKYCVCYWPYHLRKSSAYRSGSLLLSDTERALFPRSPSFAQIEMFFWPLDPSFHDHFTLALEVRRGLPSNESAIIQTLLNIAALRRRLSMVSDAAQAYFEAWTLSKKCFGDTSDYAAWIAKLYTSVVSETGASAHNEEVYQWLWVYYKGANMQTTTEALDIAKLLALLYAKGGKPDKAADFGLEVWTICGHGLNGTDDRMSELLKLLTTVLQDTSKAPQLIDISLAYLRSCKKSLPVWDAKRMQAVLALAVAYEQHQQLTKAEKLFKEYLNQLTDALNAQPKPIHICIHLAKILTTLEFANFFIRRSSQTEAELMLVQLWSTTTTFFRSGSAFHDEFLAAIEALGDQMEKLGALATAEEIFSALWLHYKKHIASGHGSKVVAIGYRLSQFYAMCGNNMAEELILKELLRLYTISATATDCGVEVCVHLSGFYERSSDWQQLIHVCSSSLLQLWAQILDKDQAKVFLPVEHDTKAIQLAIRLAIAFERQHRTKDAEDLYSRIFSSCKASLRLLDVEVLTTAGHLAEFYENRALFSKACDVYSSLRSEYCSMLGPTHVYSIAVSYHLARLHEKQSDWKSAEKLYVHIYTGLLTAKSYCSPQSIDAALALCRLYEDGKVHGDTAKVYLSLWGSFCIERQCLAPGTGTVMDLYGKLRKIIEEGKLPSVTLEELTWQCESYYSATYGLNHSQTLQAMLLRARLYESSDARRQEAISLYERLSGICGGMDISVQLDIMLVDIKKSLASLYVLEGSTTGKAEHIFLDLWESSKRSHGVGHSSSMEVLKLLVNYYKKQNNTAKALSIMQGTVMDIVMQEKDSQLLFSSAKAIAQLYIRLGKLADGLAVAKHLREQLSTRDKSQRDPYSATVVKYKYAFKQDRKYQIFLIAFEKNLHNPTSSFEDPNLLTEILSNLLAENELFEMWLRSIQTGQKLEVKLSAGSRLYIFLNANERDGEAKEIYEQLWGVFKADFERFEEAKQTNGVASGDKLDLSMMREFFEITIRQLGMEHRDSEISIIDAGIAHAEGCLRKGSLAGAFAMVSWVYRCMKVDEKFSSIFRLLFVLTSQPVKDCKDVQLRDKLVELSQIILQELFSDRGPIKLRWTEQPIEDLNKMLVLLGQEKQYATMLTILLRLWEERSDNDTWTPQVVLNIGRRLCEIYFVLSDQVNAVKLCERICYNYERVWGILNPETLDFNDFLSHLYTASNRAEKATALHEKILRKLAEPKTKSHFTSEELDRIIFRQIDLLGYSLRRSPPSENPEQKYSTLIQQLVLLYGHESPRWNELRNVQSWTKKSKRPSDETFGLWTAPEKWSLIDDDENPHAAPGNMINGTKAKPLTNGTSTPVRSGSVKGTSLYGADKTSKLFSKRSFYSLFST